MSINKCHQYDPSTKTTIGESTLALHSGAASKGMAWMVAGVRKRIKQPLAYHLTPESVHGGAVRLVNEELIKAVEEKTSGKIMAYMTDMCATNLHLCKFYDIDAKREGEINFDCIHPIDPERQLAILPDFPHVGKNCISSLANNKEFTLPESLSPLCANIGCPLIKS